MIGIWRDIQHSLRMLRRNPGFTFVAVLTLALGIGATSAIFSIVNGVLLRPLPYTAPDRLAVIWEQNRTLGLPYMFASPPNYADWRDRTRAFEEIGAFGRERFLLEQAGEADVVHGASVTASMLSVIGSRPLLGRVLTPADDAQGSARVALVSHGSWQNRFGGDPDLIGRSIRLDGNAYTVVGVMPPGFEFPPPIVLEGAIPTGETEVWVPFAMDMQAGNRGAHFLTVIGRLKPDVEIGRAEEELRSIASQLEEEYPASNAGWDVTVRPLDEQVLGDVSAQLLILLGAVCLVLLIGCVNVANLLLARGTTRLKELALRASLGAGRARLIGQMLTESLSLAFLGGLLGLALAIGGAGALVRLAPPDIPRLDEVAVDVRVLMFTLFITLLTGVLFGLAPAIQSVGENLGQRLRASGRGQAEGRRSSRLRDVLVVAEVGTSLVLLVGAGLLVQSFFNLRSVETGFAAADRLTARVTLPAARYPESSHLVAAYGELERRLNSTRGIGAAGFINDIPLAADRGGTSFLREGETEPPPGENRSVNLAAVTPSYFRALGVQLIRGRGFSDRDAADSEGVVVVNDAFLQQHFPDEDLIGSRLGLYGRSFRIVGVVGGVRHASLRADPNPSVYLPYAQAPYWRSLSLVARSETRLDAAIANVRDVVRQFDRALPLYDVRTMEEVLGGSLARMRYSTTLMFAFALVALLLAAVGIYGVIAYSVSRRTQEIGVRVAVGAATSDVLRLVLRQGMRPVGIGILTGFAASLILSRFLSRLLFGIGEADAVTLLGVGVLVSVIALLACYVPARRAMRVDPVRALRYE